MEKFLEFLKTQNVREVARQTGLHYHTIHKLISGEQKNPTWNTCIKIKEFYEKHNQEAAQ